MFKFLKKPKTLVTHAGTFHTDDVVACAALQVYLDKKGERYRIVRTRVPLLIESGDFVFDVGGEHDQDRLRFDHHQHGGAGRRENGVPYAAAGLVWQYVGPKICKSQDIADYIDARLIQPVDAVDNGVNITQSVIDEVYPYTVQSMTNSFRPTWKEEYLTDDEQFEIAVAHMKIILLREIVKAEARIDARDRIHSYVQKSVDPRIVVIDGAEKFSREDILPVLCEMEEPIFFVYQKTADSFWKTEGVRKQSHDFELRKSLPAAWCGKRDDELVQASGLHDAIFCHNGGFLIVTGSRESANRAAQLALEN